MGIVWLGNLAAAPSTPAVNEAYYDLLKKKSFIWNGTEWSQMTEDGWDGAYATACYKVSDIYPANPPQDGSYNGLVEVPPTGWEISPSLPASNQALYESRSIWRYNGIEWVQTLWSAPIRISGKDGDILPALVPDKPAYTSIIFLNKSTKPATPTGGSYDGDPLTEVYPLGGWRSDPTQPTVSQYTWLSTTKYIYNNSTGLYEHNGWSEPIKFSGEKGEIPQYGIDYTLPDGSYISYVYKIAPVGVGVTPIPNGDGSYDGVTEVLPTGWSDDAFTVTKDQELWMSFCRYTESNGVWSTSTWRLPKKISGAHGYSPLKGQDYFDGKDGSFVSYIFRNSVGVPPEPIGGSYDGVGETYPSFWFDNPTAPPTGSATYYCRAKYINTGTIENPIWIRQPIPNTADNWSKPLLFTGESAKSLVVTADSNVFKFDKNGTNPAPTSITIVANTSNLDGLPDWVIEPAITIASPLIGVSSITITATEFGIYPSIKVIATLGVYSDSTTIVRVQDGQDGTAGAATEVREVRFQFAPDNSGTSWHDKPMLPTDIYMREGTFYDGVLQGTWSDGTKIVGDDGVNVYTEFWFGDITATGNPDTNPTAWSQTQTASNTLLITRTVTNNVAGAWGDIVYIRGDDGVDGKYFETRFKKGSLALGAPSAPTDYLVTDLEPAGWSINPDIPLTGDEVIWAITAVKLFDGTLDVNWSGTAVQWGAYNPRKGIDYSDGRSVYLSKVYKQAPDGYTIPPTANTGSWDGVNETLPDGGWVDDPMTPAVGNFVYESSFLYVAPIVNGTATFPVNAGTWSTPTKYAYIPTLGTDYKNGDSSFTSYIFKNVPLGTDPATVTVTGGSYDGTNEIIPTGWFDDIVSPAPDEITIVSSRIYKAIEGVWQTPPAWSTPVRFTSSNTLVGFLDNEIDAVQSDFNGNNLIFDGTETGNFIVYYGTKNVTADCTYIVAGGTSTSGFSSLTKNGLTMTINTTTGNYVLSGSSWNTDKETFTLVATHNVSGAVVSKVFTMTKTKTGQVGLAGTANRLDIAFADDAAGNGFSINPTGKSYLGTNVVTWVAGNTEPSVSTNPLDYEWTLIKGSDGLNGYSNRVDFAYGDNSDGSGNTKFATGKLSTSNYVPPTPTTSTAYLGTNTVTWITGNAEPAVSTVLTDYEWTKIKGNDGNDAPEKYTWVVYSNSTTTGTISLTKGVYKYTGVRYGNLTSTPDTTDHTLYKWALTVDVINLSDNTIFAGSLLAQWIDVIDLFAKNISVTGYIEALDSTGTKGARLQGGVDVPFKIFNGSTNVLSFNTIDNSLNVTGTLNGELGSGTITSLAPFTQDVLDKLVPTIQGTTGGTVKAANLPVTMTTSPVLTTATVGSANSNSIDVSYDFYAAAFDAASGAGSLSYSLYIKRKLNSGTYTTVFSLLNQTGNIFGGGSGEPLEQEVTLKGIFTDTTHGALADGTDSVTYELSIVRVGATGGIGIIRDLTITQTVEGGGVAGNATTLNGQAGGYYLDWDNFINLPTSLAGYGITLNYLQSTWQTIDLNTLGDTGYMLRFDHYSTLSPNRVGVETNNANSVLTLNTHSGNYQHQLAFTNNGKIYHRYNDNTAFYGWNQVAMLSSANTWLGSQTFSLPINVVGSSDQLIKLQTTNATNWCYAGFYDSSGTRMGYVGADASRYMAMANNVGTSLTLRGSDIDLNGNVYVGWAGNKGLWSRHINGKSATAAADDHLYLNHSNGKNVYINGNLTYHAGNLPSTNMSWTGSQAFNGDTTAITGLATLGNQTTTIAAIPINSTIPTGASAGAIEIELPQSWVSTMLTFDIVVFNYASGGAFTVRVAGYNYTNGWWVNTSCHVLGQISDTKTNVRFGHNGTKCCIWIGDTTSNWSYAKVSIQNFTASYNNFTASMWNKGWNARLVTSMPNVDATYSYNGLVASRVYANSGTVTAPSISFDDDKDTGFYRYGNDIIGVAVGGTTPLTFRSGTYGTYLNSHVHAANYKINYLNQVHFYNGLWLTAPSNQYLDLKYANTTQGGIKVRDGNGATKGYVFSDVTGFGLLNQNGVWGIKTTSGSTELMYGGSYKFKTVSDGAYTNGVLYATSHGTGVAGSKVMTWDDFLPVEPPTGLENTITANWIGAGAIQARHIQVNGGYTNPDGSKTVFKIVPESSKPLHLAQVDASNNVTGDIFYVTTEGDGFFKGVLSKDTVNINSIDQDARKAIYPYYLGTAVGSSQVYNGSTSISSGGSYSLLAVNTVGGKAEVAFKLFQSVPLSSTTTPKWTISLYRDTTLIFTKQYVGQTTATGGGSSGDPIEYSSSINIDDSYIDTGATGSHVYKIVATKDAGVFTTISLNYMSAESPNFVTNELDDSTSEETWRDKETGYTIITGSLYVANNTTASATFKYPLTKVYSCSVTKRINHLGDADNSNVASLSTTGITIACGGASATHDYVVYGRRDTALN